jgi:hypothetical protein
MDAQQVLKAQLIDMDLIDQEANLLTAYNFITDGFEKTDAPLDELENQKFLDYWQRREVWERAPSAEIIEFFEQVTDRPYLSTFLIDVPFVQGTMVVGLEHSQIGRNGLLIDFMREICTLLSLGYRRASDLAERRRRSPREKSMSKPCSNNWKETTNFWWSLSRSSSTTIHTTWNS